MNPSRCFIRAATAADLEAINQIYNHYVLHSTCTYQEVPETAEGRRLWFSSHDAAHPVTVAEVEGYVAGWASLSPFHPRSAFRFTAEDSVYVDPNYQRQGIGSTLLKDLLSRAAKVNCRAVVAAIDSAQAGSIAVHARCGFEKAGQLRRVGYKFGQWLDVVYMQCSL